MLTHPHVRGQAKTHVSSGSFAGHFDHGHPRLRHLRCSVLECCGACSLRTCHPRHCSCIAHLDHQNCCGAADSRRFGTCSRGACSRRENKEGRLRPCPQVCRICTECTHLHPGQVRAPGSAVQQLDGRLSNDTLLLIDGSTTINNEHKLEIKYPEAIFPTSWWKKSFFAASFRGPGFRLLPCPPAGQDNVSLVVRLLRFLLVLLVRRDQAHSFSGEPPAPLVFTVQELAVFASAQ